MFERAVKDHRGGERHLPALLRRPEFQLAADGQALFVLQFLGHVLGQPHHLVLGKRLQFERSPFHRVRFAAFLKRVNLERQHRIDNVPPPFIAQEHAVDSPVGDGQDRLGVDGAGADFDSAFGQLMTDLAGHAGPVFDAIYQHVDQPPPTPVAEHTDAFVEWTAAHLVHPLNLYTAYPDVTVKEIQALASAADVSGAGEQRPFLVILPTRSRLAFIEIQLLLRARGRGPTDRPLLRPGGIAPARAGARAN